MKVKTIILACCIALACCIGVQAAVSVENHCFTLEEGEYDIHPEEVKLAEKKLGKNLEDYEIVRLYNENYGHHYLSVEKDILWFTTREIVWID